MKQRYYFLYAVAGLLLAQVVQAADIEGTLQWLRRVELGTSVSGVVSEVSVDVGKAVKKDTVLVKLDDRGFNAEVTRAKAEKNHAQQLFAEAKRELERSRELYDRTVLSDHELELAKIGFAKAQANAQAANAALTRAQLDLEYSSVRAPFDGMVIEQKSEVGQTIVTDLTPEPLLIFAESKRMLVNIVVDANTAAKLSRGQVVKVEAGGKEYKGRIHRVGLEPRPNTKQYLVEVVFELPDGAKLRAGMKASVDLP